MWESKTETFLEAGLATVSNENDIATYSIVGGGESWVIAIMVHVGIKARGDGGGRS